MLFAEHSGDDEFSVLEATVASTGWTATFVRALQDGLRRLDAFFRRTGHAYTRFNYLGEWHSHPSFALHPSSLDDATMLELVRDVRVGARFVVLIIVQMEGDNLRGRAWAYSPTVERQDVQLVIDGT